MSDNTRAVYCAVAGCYERRLFGREVCATHDVPAPAPPVPAARSPQEEHVKYAYEELEFVRRGEPGIGGTLAEHIDAYVFLAGAVGEWLESWPAAPVSPRVRPEQTWEQALIEPLISAAPVSSSPPSPEAPTTGVAETVWSPRSGTVSTYNRNVDPARAAQVLWHGTTDSTHDPTGRIEHAARVDLAPLREAMTVVDDHSQLWSASGLQSLFAVIRALLAPAAPGPEEETKP